MKRNLSDEVSGAIHFEKPIVALESTVISHGLPYPQNLETARRLERLVRENGAIPATIAIFGGEAYIGLSDEQLEELAKSPNIRKISRRDMVIAAARKLDGATTVAGTMILAHAAGIRVFATGGIGGVHRGTGSDVSADLPELQRTPMIVVCSGAKIVLDLPATREWLETWGVTVLGWKCDEMPAFYSRTSGLPVDARIDNESELARFADMQKEMKLNTTLLLTVPVPGIFEVPSEELEKMLIESLKKAAAEKISGKDVTPFLLSELSERSGGRTLRANIALLENNAKVAARIAAAL
ncbi:MAG: pseudouridine-5'-phosphate glycosidase [Blastocatellia bacterium]|nr:pseudouridine-5'-phosphate glycosidase [Blastocatellia bacterium]